MLRFVTVLFFSFSCFAGEWENTWRAQEKMDVAPFEKVEGRDLRAEISRPTNYLGVDKGEEQEFVSNVPQDERALKNKGQQEYYSNTFLHELEGATNPSGKNKEYLEKAKKIGEIAEKLIKSDITQYLRTQGIDIECTSMKSSNSLRDDPYVQGWEEYTQRDEVYEPFYCEQLFNVYDCTDTLEVHCLQFSQRPEQMRIHHANFKYTVKDNLMTMRHDYKPEKNGYQKTGGGMFSSGSLFGSRKERVYEACEADLRVSFELFLHPEVMSEFALLNVSYTGYVWITVNGKTAFSSPANSTNLQFTGEYFKHKYKRGNVIKKTTYVDYYPIVNLGNRKASVGYDGPNGGFNASIDLRPFLVKGMNELIIKGVSTDRGFVQAQMRSFERLCLKWSDDRWNEACKLRYY